MATDLINIGQTGANAARSALSVTAQNIANANNPAYSRRTIELAEVTATGGIGRMGDARLSGVRVEGIGRSTSTFLQVEARRTGSDLARADVQLAGLKAAETSLEQAGVYPALVEFEAGLSALAADPLSAPLRTQLLENAGTLASSFSLAAQGLDSAADQARFAAADDVARVNVLTAEIARTNSGLARAQDGSVSKAALLDQRDSLLADLSARTGITTEFDAAGRATVRLGGSAGPLMVSGEASDTLAMTVEPAGTISFTLGGNPVSPGAGSLAGQAQLLDRLGTLRGELDTVAADVIARVNAAQASGAAPDGTTGQSMFSGTGAGDIAVIMSSGAGIATAPAGSAPNSRNIANLTALQASLANGGPTSAMDNVLFALSSEISSRGITRDALATIAGSAASQLASETAVDLDNEAANLIRYQQAFQASGRVIQTAADIFDSILSIR
ncbi:flagellar hook-associated protein FlgK [Allopontixanthobacter sediminis]|uniref:Flagellar hook-associated protein 1 n=1 Tax=Allopontixanthobacter sediminis TaxID=1689985 RepID=A0A845B676_9SPHN|nr:flagellar hook-associated protein FlgK [Allopontixanthobacter sediminis]